MSKIVSHISSIVVISLFWFLGLYHQNYLWAVETLSWILSVFALIVVFLVIIFWSLIEKEIIEKTSITSFVIGQLESLGMLGTYVYFDLKGLFVISLINFILYSAIVVSIYNVKKANKDS